ncbi:MAG: hypothetical protein IPM81_17280 [Saprospirales bacterium]|nr:hypothetical protein [Saprospirales bacterium]
MPQPVPQAPQHWTRPSPLALAAWARGSAGLAADVAYRASERYCIRQSQLWQIYAAIEDRGLGAAISRTIFNRARDVVDETPLAAQPADRSFLEGENVIRKTLEHLRVVAAFYAGALQAGGGQENIAGPLPPSNGFQVLTALEATANPLQADALFRRFIADNQYVRGILLGDDATPLAGILDDCLFDSGQAIDSGRGLWVKSHALLRAQISTWLGVHIPHDYAQLRGVFVSPLGKPTGVLTKTEPFNFTTVSLKIVQAAQAG